MAKAKRKQVTDAQLAESCIAYGHALRLREATGDWSVADKTGDRLLTLCMRAAKERERK